MLDIKKLKRHFFTKNKQFNFFLVVTPSFEKLALEELKEVYPYVNNIKIVKGGVVFSSDLNVIYAVHNYCRIPIRLLLRLGTYICNSEKQIYKNLTNIPFENYLGHTSLNIKVYSRSSWIYNEKKLENIVKNFFLDKYKNKFSFDKNGIMIFFRMNHNRLTVSMDLTGEPLYKRGISKLKTQTPMRECNIAAAMRLINLENYKYIIDPFCGSGTILIESYINLKLKSMIPDREFNFTKIPINLFIKNNEMNTKPYIQKISVHKHIFIGLDISFYNLKVCKKNINNFFANKFIWLLNSDAKNFFFKLDKEDFIIFTNPPFGWKLLDRGKADILLKLFFDRMYQCYKKFKFGIFYPDSKILDSLSINKITFPFGGHNINFYFN